MQKGTAEPRECVLLKCVGMILLVILCAWQLTLLHVWCWEALCDLWSRGHGGQIQDLDLAWKIAGDGQTRVST